MKRSEKKQRISRRSIFMGIVVVALLAYGGSFAFASLLTQNWYGPIRITPGYPSTTPPITTPIYPKYPAASSAPTAVATITYTCAYHVTNGMYRCRRTTIETNGTTKVDFGKTCTVWSECQGMQGGYATTPSQGTAQCGSYAPGQCTIYCTEYPVGGRADDEGARVKRCLKACGGGAQLPCYAPGKRCSIASECYPDTPECRAGSSGCMPDIGTVEPVSDYHLTGGTTCVWNDQCRSGVCEPWWYFSRTQTDSQCTCVTDAHCATGQVCGVVNYHRACVAAPQSSRSSQGIASSAFPPYRPPDNPPPPLQSSRSSAQASSRSNGGMASSASSTMSYPGMCTSDAGCNGQFCVNNQCVGCLQSWQSSPDAARRQCPYTSYCADDGRCLTKKRGGSSCRSNVECVASICSQYGGSNGMCGCSTNAHCESGLVCAEGTCITPQCNTNTDCGGKICINQQCKTCMTSLSTGPDVAQRQCPSTAYCAEDGRCKDKKTAGTPCQNSIECVSSNCRGAYAGRSGVCGCSASAPCPAGQICSYVSECVTASSAQSSSLPRLPPAASSSALGESCTARAMRIYQEALRGAMQTYQQSMLQCLSSPGM